MLVYIHRWINAGWLLYTKELW